MHIVPVFPFQACGSLQKRNNDGILKMHFFNDVLKKTLSALDTSE